MRFDYHRNMKLLVNIVIQVPHLLALPTMKMVKKLHMKRNQEIYQNNNFSHI